MYKLIVSSDGAQNGVQVGNTCINEITADRKEAEKLLSLLQRNQVSELHVWDVIEDWFGQM